MTLTSGNRLRTADAVPSVDASSTTTIRGRSASSSRRVARTRSRRARVARTIVGSGDRRSPAKRITGLIAPSSAVDFAPNRLESARVHEGYTGSCRGGGATSVGLLSWLYGLIRLAPSPCGSAGLLPGLHSEPRRKHDER